MDVQESVMESDVDEPGKLLVTHEQVDCPVLHRFGKGIYIREAQLPAGSVIIGHKHKVACLNQMLFGKIIVASDGNQIPLMGFNVFEGAVGEQKAAIVIEDTVWQNIWANPDDCRDIDKLEERYLDKSELPYELERSEFIKTSIEEDRKDFLAVLDEFAMDPDEVRRISENESDQIDMPAQWMPFTAVRKSDIEGRGLFLSWPHAEGDIVAPARIDGSRTPAGRYVNHSANPNCFYAKDDKGDIYLMAVRDINGCVGGDKGEELTVDYRQALDLNGVKRKDALCQQRG